MKLAIIGRGTVGCISAAFFLRNTDWEIEWYFDPDIKPLSVGEGSFVGFADLLYKNVDFTYDSLKKVDGTIKTGINKVGWGDKNFINNFPPPYIGYHFDAVKLQDYITTYLKDNRRIKFINKNVTHDDIDADFIMDCSGKPKNLEDYNASEFIPVNSAYVTQCYWDYPKFSETLSIARPYGWIFGFIIC